MNIEPAIALILALLVINKTITKEQAKSLRDRANSKYWAQRVPDDIDQIIRELTEEKNK